MQYIGYENELCVISFLPVTELERPVGFDGQHAFECSSVVHWLKQYRGSHPITGERIQPVPVAAVLHPLVISGRIDHLTCTRRILEQAGSVINLEANATVLCPFLGNRTASFLCPYLLLMTIGTSGLENQV